MPTAGQHLGKDKFTSVSVTVADKPLQLGRLQQFLRGHMPEGLVRMKVSWRLWFAFPLLLCVHRSRRLVSEGL